MRKGAETSRRWPARLFANLRLAASLFVGGDEESARLLAAAKEAFREVEAEAAHCQRLQSSNVSTVETSSLHLDASPSPSSDRRPAPH